MTLCDPFSLLCQNFTNFRDTHRVFKKTFSIYMCKRKWGSPGDGTVSYKVDKRKIENEGNTCRDNNTQNYLQGDGGLDRLSQPYARNYHPVRSVLQIFPLHMYFKKPPSPRSRSIRRTKRS